MIDYNWGNEIRSPSGAANTTRHTTQEVVAPMCTHEHTPTPTIQQEMWLPIVGYVGVYEVSNFGRVRRFGGRALRPIARRDGYAHVCLSKSGKILTVMIHRLVALAFLGPRPDGLVINHKDGNKRNNRAANLEYITYQENSRHAIDFLGIGRGDRHGQAKLNTEQVIEIRRAFANGEKALAEIARDFRISRTHAARIVNGKSWTHLPETKAPEGIAPRRLHGRDGHCSRGHEVSEQNTYFHRNGRIAYCKICYRERRQVRCSR